MLVDLFAHESDQTLRSFAAWALRKLFHDQPVDPEFSHVAAAVRQEFQELSALAKDAIGKILDRSPEDDPIGATIGAICRLDTVTERGRAQVRLGLARIWCELSVRQHGAIDTGLIKTIGQALRGEARQPEIGSRPDLPHFESLTHMLDWLDNPPRNSEAFPAYFFTAWKRHSHSAWNIVRRPIVEPPVEVEDLGDGSQGLQIQIQLDEASEREDGDTEPPGSIPGWIPEDPDRVPDGIAALPPQARDIVLGATLSTQMALSAMSAASTTVLDDAEMTASVASMRTVFDEAREVGDLVRSSRAVANMLSAATATPLHLIDQLKWGSPRKGITFPGVISLDGEWLLRPELTPDADGSGHPMAFVWIPLPRTLVEMMHSLQPELTEGCAVLHRPEGVSTWSLPGMPSDAALRRTLISRLARSEPLGLTAAQWVAGDTLGVSEVPLHYDWYRADALARQVEAITFPWFGERAGRPRAVRPMHFLGSKVEIDTKAVRMLISRLRARLNEQGLSDVERLVARTDYVVHGLALATGHRPSNGYELLTRHNFSIGSQVGVLHDKRVAPEWRDRPVVLPKGWCKEFSELLADLDRVRESRPGSALAGMATRALNGQGPVFLRVLADGCARAYNGEDYRASLPEVLSGCANFARHLLNRNLIGRVLEPLRTGQMGWHGAREGAWADGSPWSVISAVSYLDGPITTVMKALGWLPVAREARPPPAIALLPIDRCAAEAEHKREHREHRKRNRTRLNERMAAIRGDVVRRFRRLVSENLPTLAVNDGGNFIATSADVPLTPLVGEAWERVQRELPNGGPRSLEAAVSRNILHDAVRKGRRDGVVSGRIPRPVIFNHASAPGPFSAMQPSALDHLNALEHWLAEQLQLTRLSKPIGSTSPTGTGARLHQACPHRTDSASSAGADAGLSEAAIAVLAQVLHGPHSHIKSVEAVLKSTNRAYRTERTPGQLLVASHAEGSEGGLADSRAHVLHGLSALHWMRWHRNRGPGPIDFRDVEAELLAKIPTHLRLKGEAILDQLMALKRAAAGLRFDGIARPVAIGRLNITVAPLPTLLAWREDRGISTAGNPLVEGANAESIGFVPSHLMDSQATASRIRLVKHRLSGLRAILSSAAKHESDGTTAPEIRRREKAKAKLFEWIRSVNRPRAVDWLARYALALLTSGGIWKPVLRIRTIQGYVDAIAEPLITAMRWEMASATSASWQQVFRKVVAVRLASVRRTRFKGLQKFHIVLSREMAIPEVDFAELAQIAGSAIAFVDAGMLSGRQRAAVADALRADVDSLDTLGASPSAIHGAKCRMLANDIAQSVPIRTGEVHGLPIRALRDVIRTGRVAITKSRYQSLKTANARRRPMGQGPAWLRVKQGAVAWLDGAWTLHNLGDSSRKPLFFDIDEPSRQVPRETLFRRTGELLRWATGNRDASFYWNRKSVIQDRLSNLLKSSQTSLWPTRDLLAANGHASIDTPICSYTHDPSIPFLRWIGEQPAVDAARLASALGCSESTIARRLAGLQRVQRAPPRLVHRVEAILAGELSENSEASAEDSDPPPMKVRDSYHPTVRDVARVLRSALTEIDSDDRLIVAAARHRWPSDLARSLRDSVVRMQEDYGVSFDRSRKKRSVTILPSRPLERHKDLDRLLDSPKASPTVLELADRWLGTAGWPGAPDGIAASDADWARWCKELPVLQAVGFRSRIHCGRPFQTIPSGCGTGQSAWPGLRWLLIVSWLHRTISGQKNSQG